MAGYDENDDLDVFEEDAVDTAEALTSGLVISTTVLLVIALVTALIALERIFGVGPMAN